MITMLFGRTVDHWCDVSRVMEEHGIETAAQLEERLSFKSALREVSVVDAKNPQRFLGRIVGINLSQLQSSHVFNMAVMPEPMACSYASPLTEVTTEIVRFAVGRTTHDGWTYTPRLETNEALATLLKLEKFRLPDETERQFRDRWRSR